MLVQPLTGSDILLCGIQSTPDAVRKRGTKEPEDQAHGRALFARPCEFWISAVRRAGQESDPWILLASESAGPRPE